MSLRGARRRSPKGIPYSGTISIKQRDCFSRSPSGIAMTLHSKDPTIGISMRRITKLSQRAEWRTRHNEVPPLIRRHPACPNALCRGPRIPLDKQRDAKSAQGLNKKSLLLKDSRDFLFEVRLQRYFPLRTDPRNACLLTTGITALSSACSSTLPPNPTAG